MIVAMNPEILTRFHRTCVVPLHFWFRTHKMVNRAFLAPHLLDKACSCNRWLTYYRWSVSIRSCVISQVLVSWAARTGSQIPLWDVWLSVCCCYCCCRSRNHQVDSYEPLVWCRGYTNNSNGAPNVLERRTHATASQPHSRWSGQVLCHESSFGRYEWPEQSVWLPCGKFDSKSKVVGEDCRPRTTVGHL